MCYRSKRVGGCVTHDVPVSCRGRNQVLVETCLSLLTGRCVKCIERRGAIDEIGSVSKTHGSHARRVFHNH